MREMSVPPERYFTQEEYIALENKAEYRSQYVAGEIFAMDRAQVEHVVINGNITALLRNAFRCRSCQTYSTELRVRVEASEL